MKKFKKIFAVLLTLAMVLGMSVTSFAGTSGSIKVTGLKAENTEVSIYNIAKLDANGNAWEVPTWAKNITGAIDETTDPYTIDAKALADNLGTTKADATKPTATGEVEFTELEEGVYLVIAKTLTTGSTTTYSPMLAVTYQYDANTNLITGKRADVVAKSENIQVDKKAVEGDKYAAVGTDADFEIGTTFPSFHDDQGANRTGTYKIVDTPKNLSIKTDTVKVSVGGKELTKDTDYTVSNNAGVMTIEFTSTYIGKTNEHAGKAVVVEYTATVTAENGGISNTANAVVDGKTVGTDEEKVYTGRITMTKTNKEGKPLSGAQFKVYTIRDEVTYYAIIANGVVTGWTTAEKDAIAITTESDGTVTVSGLDADETYSFKEVVAPNGYSINEKDANATWEELPAGTSEGDRTGFASMIDIKLSGLPSTGGIGTTIFTIGGCLIMVIAAALFFTSRRKAAK